MAPQDQSQGPMLKKPTSEGIFALVEEVLFPRQYNQRMDEFGGTEKHFIPFSDRPVTTNKDQLDAVVALCHQAIGLAGREHVQAYETTMQWAALEELATKAGKVGEYH